jgi:uncharacterized protein (TIGR02246 family)
MSGHRPVVLVALCVYLCCGCQREPADTRAQDERAIREADAATLKAAQAKDADGAVANYAEDGSWLPPNAPMMTGKAAIRAGWSKLMGSPGFNIDWQIDKLEVGRAGDLAYTIYTYQLALEGPNGKPIADHGKDMAIWKKQADGGWKMVADTFNSDLPVVAPAKAAETKATRQRAGNRRPRKRRKSR